VKDQIHIRDSELGTSTTRGLCGGTNLRAYSRNSRYQVRAHIASSSALENDEFDRLESFNKAYSPTKTRILMRNKDYVPRSLSAIEFYGSKSISIYAEVP